MKAKTILVPLESYIYLNNKRRSERSNSDKPLNEERLAVNFNRFARDGYKQIMDGDFGGCIGTRWTSWSCEDMKRILDKAGLPYKDGDDVEYIQL